MKEKGLAVMLHPFILMDVPPSNNRPDPGGAPSQPAYPWRGRISVGAHDRTPAASADIAGFFGTASRTHFSIASGAVVYSGPDEWSFRRMVLHMAHLCVLAGGVEAFLLGSELVGLSTARDGTGAYPFVAALRSLAAEVRAVLGPATRISYGADWSEYNGHQPADEPGGKRFHLDPFWADGVVDFIGIDWYPPLADWREGGAHQDAGAYDSLYDGAYLAANVEGGEYFDWYYASAADRQAQARTPIADGAYGEPFVWRAKDIRGFWSNLHYDRPGGGRASAPTAWVPQSKPIRFTEIGVPAVDKGANQPNVFYDPKSAESALPHFSTGARDDLMQRRGLEALLAYWRADGANPVSPLYGGPMVETARAYVWAYDARPFPFFPARADIWGDAGNWSRGHWLNGRLGRAPLAELIRALAAPAGVAVDVARVEGEVAGYVLSRPLSPREAIDPLADLFRLDMAETPTALRFQGRDGPAAAILTPDDLVASASGDFTETIGEAGDVPSAFRLLFIDEGKDYQPGVAEAKDPGRDDRREVALDIPAALSDAAATRLADAALADAGAVRSRFAFSLPPSRLDLEPGDVVLLAMGGTAREARLVDIADRAEGGEGPARRVEAVRRDLAATQTAGFDASFAPPATPPDYGPPVFELMDLPSLGADATSPTLQAAAFADPWPGAVALYEGGEGERLAATLPTPSTMGRLEAPLAPAGAGRRDGRTVRVRLLSGALESRPLAAVFAGANAAAVETAAGWEVLQFETAVLGSDGAWTLSGLLRGQAGTEREAAAGAAAGARFALLNAAVESLAVPFDRVGDETAFAGGPAGEPPTAPTFLTRTITPTARSLKPLSPAHLRAQAGADGITLGWIRRTRLGGDNWTGEDVPLGEAFERYRVEIRRAADGALVRTAETTAPAFFYDAASLAADFPAAAYPLGRPALRVRVAQLSASVGPGEWAEAAIA